MSQDIFLKKTWGRGEDLLFQSQICYQAHNKGRVSSGQGQTKANGKTGNPRSRSPAPRYTHTGGETPEGRHQSLCEDSPAGGGAGQQATPWGTSKLDSYFHPQGNPFSGN